MQFINLSRERATTVHDELVADDATVLWDRPIIARVGNLLLVAADPSEPWKARVLHWRERQGATASWFTEVGEFTLNDLILIGAHAAITKEY